jgi:BSD domain
MWLSRSGFRAILRIDYTDGYKGENVYREAQQELSAVGEEATKGFTSLQSSILSRTRALSLNQKGPETSTEDAGEGSSGDPDSITEKTIQESEGVLARLRSEAAKRLKEIEKAEDAADEALLKFGTNIRNFLRDAVTIAPPTEGSQEGATVLFESKDAQGKRVIHTTRFDAQLHVIHSSLDSFMNDPVSEEYAPWAKDFNVESKTDDISSDLEKYKELRTAMEKLVPGHVAYRDFWKRYYFLRYSIETAEARRRDLLKGTLVTIRF